uniref:Diaminopimelate decarboxylase n=1 Tax=Cyanothece sp. (strain PCC 7425 / ATCC 29141) TaxID=395961 RepID=B8HLE2_CYAP4
MVLFPSNVDSISSTPGLPVQSPNQQLLPLTAQTNLQGHLVIGGCDVVDLVEQFGSPLYILDETTLRQGCQHYQQGMKQFYPGDFQVLYASKAWNCLATCAIVASEGLGIDVASGGELYTALQAGVNPDKIYFHGNNKSLTELELALGNGCAIVADNWLELQRLATLADQFPSPPRVMLRLTPGIECHTHEYIRTGHLDNKFGFDPNQLEPLLEFASKHPQIHWLGFHAHIGSQIFELQPHTDLSAVLVDWLVQAKAAGLGMNELNVGGGLGIRYLESDQPPSITEWVKTVTTGIIAACQSRNLPLPKLLCEPGRSLVGPAGLTAYRMGGRKDVPGIRTYVAVDGGMSDNPRPITYQAVYRAVVGNHMAAPLAETVTIAGKHCESGDVLIKDIQLPATQPDDIFVVLTTGAYNYSMASNYNRLTRPAAVLVKEGEANLILRRETYSDLLRQDVLPQRLV